MFDYAIEFVLKVVAIMLGLLICDGIKFLYIKIKNRNVVEQPDIDIEDETHAIKTQSVRFFSSEDEIWNHLQKQEYKDGYIKDLIRKDILSNS